MSLLWCYDCGARHSSAQVPRAFTSINSSVEVVANSGRGGNTPQIRIGATNFQPGEMQYGIRKTFSTTLVDSVYVFQRIRFSHLANSLANQTVFALFAQNGTSVLQLRTGATTGTDVINLWINGVKVADNVITMTTNQQCLEIYLRCHASSGSATIHVDGVETATVTGLSFSNLGVTQAGWFAYRSPDNYGALSLQDVIVYKNDAVAPNSWLGPTAFIHTSFPTANGTINDFSAVGAATNWECVDDAIADDAATSVLTSTIGAVETYNFADLPSNVTDVIAVAPTIQAQPNGVGSSFYTKGVVKDSSGTHVTGVVAGASTWSDIQFPMSTNPATGTAWTVSAVNSGEFGFTHVAAE